MAMAHEHADNGGETYDSPSVFLEGPNPCESIIDSIERQLGDVLCDSAALLASLAETERIDALYQNVPGKIVAMHGRAVRGPFDTADEAMWCAQQGAWRPQDTLVFSVTRPPAVFLHPRIEPIDGGIIEFDECDEGGDPPPNDGKAYIRSDGQWTELPLD